MGMFVGMTMRSPRVNQNIQDPYYNVYLIESRAMCHIVKDDKNMSNVMQKNKVVIVGDRRKMLLTNQGIVRIETLEGNILTLFNTLYVPEMATNIISVSRLIKKGNAVMAKANKMTISNGSNEIRIAKPEDCNVFYLKGLKNQTAMKIQDQK
jgi:hypothetical protein